MMKRSLVRAFGIAFGLLGTCLAANAADAFVYNFIISNNSATAAQFKIVNGPTFTVPPWAGVNGKVAFGAQVRQNYAPKDNFVGIQARLSTGRDFCNYEVATVLKYHTSINVNGASPRTKCTAMLWAAGTSLKKDQGSYIISITPDYK